jgi:hypothetical protein
MSGVFQTGGPKEIRFIPQRLQVSEYTLPEGLEQRLLPRLQFRVDLGEFPLDITVSEVFVDENYLTVTGTVRGQV